MREHVDDFGKLIYEIVMFVVCMLVFAFGAIIMLTLVGVIVVCKRLLKLDTSEIEGVTNRFSDIVDKFFKDAGGS